MAKLHELRERREEAAALNLASAKEEDIELKNDPRVHARLLRKRERAEEYLAKQAANEEGIDLDRQQALTYTIEETERWQEQQAEKTARMDAGFTDFVQMTARKHDQLTRQLDPESIVKMRAAEGVEALQADIKAQRAARNSRSRRRRYDDSEDVTYINERNARFNRKASRAYDDYTAEIKDSLERGTAI